MADLEHELWFSGHPVRLGRRRPFVLIGALLASLTLVADNLPADQNSQAFAIQSLFIVLGGTVASALPWMLPNWFGVVTDSTVSHIPQSVRISFFIVAVAFWGAVLWTIFKTKECPPRDAELAAIRARKFDWTLGLGKHSLDALRNFGSGVAQGKSGRDDGHV